LTMNVLCVKVDISEKATMNLLKLYVEGLMILQEAYDFLETNLPSQPEVKEMVIAPGFTGVLLSNGDAGISMNIRKGDTFRSEENQRLLKQQTGRKALDVAREMSLFMDTVLTSIRVAILNALSSPFLNEESLRPYGLKITADNETPINASVDKRDTVTIVGFGGMVRGMVNRASKVYVTELDMDRCESLIINQRGIETGPTAVEVVHASDAERVFKVSDKIFVTGSALVTHTMEEVLQQCPSSAEVILYGHTAAFFPVPLFQRGVHISRTRRVTDSGMMMDLLKNYGIMVERLFPQASQELLIEKLG
jgi:uncharacterized protein (DUF4213/DUF364 family)